MDLIGAIWPESLLQTSFHRVPLLYSLFCTIYHMQYGLPGLEAKRVPVKRSDLPKIRGALAKIDDIFEVSKSEVDRLPLRERQFRLATDVHTIHASNRVIRADYLIDLVRSAIEK